MDNGGLPDSFVFSQQSLQDFVDCARRFQLRYVHRQPWPAFPADPPGAYAVHMQRGADFHRLAHQHALGLDLTRVEETIQDRVLASWWQVFTQRPIRDLPDTVRRAELILGSPLAGHRLAAKYDLLAAEPDRRFVVVDWKTVLRRPQRLTLSRRLQTRVYCYLAVAAGAGYNGGHPPRPEQVQMIYWFAASGGATERFQYDAAQYSLDHQYLASLVSEIAALGPEVWPLAADSQHCKWCNYRTLCEREVAAGPYADLDSEQDPFSFELELEQIAEIAF